MKYLIRMSEAVKEANSIRALFIGINKYIACNNLNYAVKDANETKNVFSSIHGNMQSTLLTDEREPRFQPLRSNILFNMKLQAENARIDDDLFFFFSGHGKDIDGEPVILPSDYRDELGMEAAIKIEDIKNCLAKSSAQFKLIILDSCHSGAVSGKDDSGRMTEAFLKAIELPPEGFVILASCNLNQISREDPNLKHGIFTYFFLEGLKGSANEKDVTIGNLYDYITPKVQKFVCDKYNDFQIPQIRANFSGIYILNKVKNNGSKKEDMMQSDFFYEIGLWQSGQRDKDSAIRDMLLVLRKEYGILGFTKKNNTQFEFKDGAITIHPMYEGNDLEFAPGIEFNYLPERQKIIDSLILNLDDKVGTWRLMTLNTHEKFDYQLLEKFCDDKKFDIVDMKIDPFSISFTCSIFSDDTMYVSVADKTDGSAVQINQVYNGGFFKPHFYTLVNPRKISELLSPNLKQ